MAELKHRIETGFARFGRMIYRNPWKTLALMVALTAALVSQLRFLTQDSSPESFFHKNDPELIRYNAFKAQFGRDEMVIAILQPKEVFDASFLRKLKSFHDALDKVPHRKKVTSLINVRHTYGKGDTLVVEDLIKEIPATPEAMAALKARVMASKLYPNLYISEDGRTTVVMVETVAESKTKDGKDGEGETDDLAGGFSEEADGEAETPFVPLTQQENQQVIEAVKKVAAAFHSADFPIQLTGQPVISSFFNGAIKGDVAKFMTMAFISFTVFLLFLFRRYSGALMPLMVVLLSLLSAVGLMALAGAPFTSVTSILPSFMMSVGIGSSVHILAIFYRRYQQTGDKEESIVYTFGHSGLPVVMTALTTAAGLFSFATAKMAPVADLGLFGGLGAMLILIFTLALMPALISLLPLKPKPRFGGQHPGQRVDRILTAIAGFSTRRAWSIVLVSAIVFAVAGSGLFFQGFGHHFMAWMPKGTPVRDAVITIDRELKGLPTIEVVLDTGKENGLHNPKLMNRIAELNTFAEAFRDENGERVVGKTTSILNVLKETNQALHGNDPAFYTVPGDANLISQELLLFETSGGAGDRERLVDSRFSKARLSFKVKDKDANKYRVFVTSLEAEANRLLGEFGEITTTGTLKMFTQTILLLMESLAVSYTIAGVVITLLMILLLGSVRIGLLSMIPNLAPIMITLGVMGWLGIKLDMSNMLVGTIAIGLAVDDTIHFFHNFRSYYTLRKNAAEAIRDTMLSTGRAMFFTTLVLVTGFMFFAFASLTNLVHFGILISSTLVLALLADMLLAPAMMELITRTPRGRALLERWGSAPAFEEASANGGLAPSESPAS